MEDRTYVRRRLDMTVPPATAPRKAQARSNLATGKANLPIVADAHSPVSQCRRDFERNRDFATVGDTRPIYF